MKRSISSVEGAWPASKVELWPLAKIRPYEKNPRTHPQSQIDLIAASMRDDGVTAPILVDEYGVIIYGHGRRLAAIQNRFSSYPVVIARGWSDAKKSAARIKDNQLGDLSGWDNELMRFELGELQLVGYDMALLGFDSIQLAQFSGEPASAAVPGISLAERFGIVPFSVFNAREGWWQDRKQAWLALGIQSEVGRGENLLKFSDAVALDGKTYKDRQNRRKKKRPAVPGRRNSAATSTYTDKHFYDKKTAWEKANGRKISTKEFSKILEGTASAEAP